MGDSGTPAPARRGPRLTIDKLPWILLGLGAGFLVASLLAVSIGAPFPLLYLGVGVAVLVLGSILGMARP